MHDPVAATGETTNTMARRQVGDVDSPEELITTIYRAVGESLGVDADEEPIPIYDVIDPEALAQLFNERNGDTYVTFPLNGHRITIHSDGEVIVRRA